MGPYHYYSYYFNIHIYMYVYIHSVCTGYITRDPNQGPKGAHRVCGLVRSELLTWFLAFIFERLGMEGFRFVRVSEGSEPFPVDPKL